LPDPLVAAALSLGIGCLYFDWYLCNSGRHSSKMNL
jgi:hypothetical protein